MELKMSVLNKLRRHRRIACVVCLGAIVVWLLLGWSSGFIHTQFASCDSEPEHISRTLIDGKLPKWDDFSHLRIAVDESGGFHDEVIAAALYQLHDTGANVTMYRDWFMYGLEDLVKPFYKGPPPIHQGHVGEDTLGDAIRNGDFDVVYLVSCENALKQRPTIVDALIATPHVQLVCLMHFVWEMQNYKDIVSLALSTKRVHIFVLSEAVQQYAYWTMGDFATQDSLSVWSEPQVEVFAPVFPLPPAISHPQSTKGRGYNRIGIQGGIQPQRRNYYQIFSDLIACVQDDPALWGYQAPSGEGQPFVPLPSGLGHNEPFTVHLVGNRHDSEFKVPPELQNVVVIHSGLSYIDFYEVLGSMDLILPAFGHDGYLINTASSSMPTPIITKTPMLVTPRHLAAYQYLGPTGVVVHPVHMHAVEAIRRLKIGQDPWACELATLQIPFRKTSFMDEDGLFPARKTLPAPNLGKNSDNMWDAFFMEIVARNREVLRPILQRVPRR